MKTVTVDWQQADARFEARGGHLGQTIVINAPHDGAPTGFSASELLLAGAGACSAWDVLEILHKQRQRVTAVAVRVDGEQAGTPPWAYQHVQLTFTVTGHRLNASKVRKAVELSERRYCAVIGTIRGVAEVDCLVDVRDADADDDDVALAHEAVISDASA
jgi:putative redox protein